MTPKPRHDCASTRIGSPLAMTCASAFEAVSMVTRTMTLPWSCWPRGSRPRTPWVSLSRPPRCDLVAGLAAQAPTAHADVREEQDDENDCEDGVDHRSSRFCVAITVPASVSSDFGEGSYPSGGFESDDGGDTQVHRSSALCTADLTISCGVVSSALTRWLRTSGARQVTSSRSDVFRPCAA